MGLLASALICLSLSFSLSKMGLTMKPIVGLLVRIPRIKHAGYRPSQLALTDLQAVVTTVLMNQQSLAV